MNMLRSIRERKGLTVGQLAARASIPSRVLTEYEEGRQPIPLPHAKLLAKALWVQMEDLLPAAGSMPRPAPNPSSPPPAPPPRPQAQTAAPPVPVQDRPAAAPPPAQGVPRDMASAGYPRPPMPPPSQAPQGQAGPPRAERYPEGGAQGQRPGQDRSGGGGGQAPRRGGADSRAPKPPRAVSLPPKPITEGQVEELLRLAMRLEMEQPRVEESMGKPIQALTRVEAKEWIKKFRDMTDEAAPGSKVRFGQWPGSREDREAAYLAQYRDSGTPFTFKLFNGEEFKGAISDFTPYTITIKLDGQEDLVLRKLAVAYYRQVPAGAATEAPAEAVPEAVAAKPARASRAKKSAAPSEEAALQAPQPAQDGLESDRAAEPATPETDSMDEDRGI